MTSNSKRTRSIHPNLIKQQVSHPSELSPKTSVRDISQPTHHKEIIFSKTSIKVVSVSAHSEKEINIKEKVLSQEIFYNHKNDSSYVNDEPNNDVRKENLKNTFVGVQNSGGIISTGQIDKLKKEDKEQGSQQLMKPQKKCYRTCHHCTVLGVPYRKCLSIMQEKIVTIINKLKNGKPCFKEIETLLQRVKKVSTKELSNKYFVSGLHVIHRLLENEENQLGVELCIKLGEVLSELKNRIIEQLDSIRYFQAIHHTPEPFQQKKYLNKNVLIRRAYRIFKKKAVEAKKQELQRKAVEISQRFMQHQPNKLQIFWLEISRA